MVTLGNKALLRTACFSAAVHHKEKFNHSLVPAKHRDRTKLYQKIQMAVSQT